MPAVDTPQGDQPQMNRPSLFLSHAGEDSDKAKELAQRLRQAGLGVWLDIDELKPGWLAVRGGAA